MYFVSFLGLAYFKSLHKGIISKPQIPKSINLQVIKPG